tara:strand:- start:139 stop:891 length:753 start_codon:yes stop_codon:yes gene_type:complete
MSTLLNKDLINYIESNNIPNIIFYGDCLTCKKTILYNFLKLIYINNDNIIKNSLIINCSYGKGNIKFIRDNLKYFANSSVINNNFKSIILLNADKLTIDAQSALRRCIELYNHNTRFFIVVEDKNKILKPILSRFSEFYCNNKVNILKIYNKDNDFCSKKSSMLYKILKNYNNKDSISILAKKLYNIGISANLLIDYIDYKLYSDSIKYKFLIIINNYKKFIKSEEILILFCLSFIFFRNNYNLNNIYFN